MIGRAGLLFVAFAAAVMTACSAVDNAIDPRYDDINRSTAKARNESILLNIVRASHNAPLNFVAFSRVSGTTSVSGNAALPNFLVGPYTKPPITLGAPVPGYSVLPTPARDVIFNKDNLGGSTIATNNFDISPLEAASIRACCVRSIFRSSTTSFAKAIRASCCSGCSSNRFGKPGWGRRSSSSMIPMRSGRA